MFFKNLQLFRIPAPFPISASQLHARLQQHQFLPCGELATDAIGWDAPRAGGLFAHHVDGHVLLALTRQKKVLPASAVARLTAERAAGIAAAQGFMPGRKQMKEIKEAVIDELLPQALSTHQVTHVWLDLANGWMAIDSASLAKGDEVIKALLGALGNFPLAGLRVAQAPLAAMTNWLAGGEAPAGFTIDQECALRAPTGNRASVRYQNQPLDTDDVRAHLTAGKQCVALALTWADRISFRLHDNLVLKRIAPLDILQEGAAQLDSDAERFDADFLLMTGEFSKLLADLVAALGGLAAAATPEQLEIPA